MIRLLLSVTLAGGLFLALLSPLSERVIFQPSPGADLDPANLGIEAEEVHLDTSDGVRIHAWYLPAGGRRALLFLHGNAGNASHRLPNAALLAGLGIDVLLLDYRGYGLSSGRPSERGVYRDARAGLNHLVETRGIPAERVVLFGRSLGGAVAVELAEGRRLGGVILESTFTSIQDMASRMIGPLSRLLDGFDSASRIERVRAPLLFFHGDRDEVVPIALGSGLFDAAPEPKAFHVLKGAGHNDTVEVGGRPYMDRIAVFLDEVVP